MASVWNPVPEKLCPTKGVQKPYAILAYIRFRHDPFQIDQLSFVGGPGSFFLTKLLKRMIQLNKVETVPVAFRGTQVAPHVKPPFMKRTAGCQQNTC
jgi:hypothetical protein